MNTNMYDYKTWSMLSGIWQVSISKWWRMVCI